MSTFGSTKFDRLRTRHVRQIRRLLAETFSLSGEEMKQQDQIWSDWIEQSKLNNNSSDILATDARDVFKARQIANDWAPSGKFSPFRSRGSSVGPIHVNINELQRWSKKLRTFALEVLVRALEISKIIGTDEFYERWYGYRHNILAMLKILEENDPIALRLFEQYELHSTFMRRQENGPFSMIMSADIPRKWKESADAEARRIVRSILKVCRPDTQRCAMSVYLDVVGSSMNNYSRKAPYNYDLFISQLDFVLNLPRVQNDPRPFLFSWQFEDFRKLLQGSASSLLTTLWHKIVREVVLYDEKSARGFDAWVERNPAPAKDLFDEFSQDTELCAGILRHFEEIEIRKAAALERQKTEKAQKIELQIAFEKML